MLTNNKHLKSYFISLCLLLLPLFDGTILKAEGYGHGLPLVPSFRMLMQDHPRVLKTADLSRVKTAEIDCRTAGKT